MGGTKQHDDTADDEVLLVPPPGSRSAKQEALQREHPVAYVLRRAAWAGLDVLVGVLAIGALLASLRLSWLPKPSLPGWLPELTKPDLLRYLDITYWLGRLGLSWPDVGIPDWAEAILDQRKYWLPIVIAIFVAIGQLERRRKIDAGREATNPDETP